jgi:hypothetical protein
MSKILPGRELDQFGGKALNLTQIVLTISEHGGMKERHSQPVAILEFLGNGDRFGHGRMRPDSLSEVPFAKCLMAEHRSFRRINLFELRLALARPPNGHALGCVIVR